MKSIVLPCCVILIAWSASTPGACAENPFRKVLGDTIYTEEIAELQEQVKEAKKLAEQDVPPIGSVVTEVLADGQAKAADISVGDVITAIDNQQLWGDQPWRRLQQTQRFYIGGPDKEVVSYAVEPGLFGVNHISFDRIDLAYLKRKENRSSDWDQHVVVGCLTWQDDPVLAETAWHKAISAGYRQDVLSDYFAALFAMDTPAGASDEIDRFMAHFPEGGDLPTVFLTGAVPLLVSDARVEELAGIAGARGDSFVWTLEELKQLQRFHDRKPFPSKSLLARARDQIGNDITKELQQYKKGTNAEPLRLSMTVVARPGNYRGWEIGHPRKLKNFHLHYKFRLRTTGKHPKWSSSFRIIVANADRSGSKGKPYPRAMSPYPDVRLVSLTVSRARDKDRLALSSGGAMAEWFLRSRHINYGEATPEQIRPSGNVRPLPDERDEDNAITTVLDVIRLDNEVGLYINDVCYLHLPVDPDIEDSRIFWHTSGMMVETLRYRMIEF